MTRQSFSLTVIAICFLFAGTAATPAVGADAPSREERSLEFFGAAEFLPAKQALLEGRFEEALALIRDEVSGRHREEALYRLGGTLIRQKRHDEALTSLEALIQEFPEGQLFHKARFLEAEALAGLKRFSEASAIYEEEIAHLISKERKEEIAQYYLKYADALAAKDREGGPRLEKAIELYRRAIDLEIPGLIDEEIRFKIAAAFHELDKYNDEGKVLVEFRNRHPKSPSLDEVEYRIARALLAEGRRAEARKAFRDFLRDHLTSIRVPEARYGIARSYNVPTPQSDTELSLGVKALKEFLSHTPDHELATKARHQIGLSYMFRGRLDEAIGSLVEFIRSCGEGEGAEELAEARFDLATCYSGQKKFAAAQSAYKEFLGLHPSHALWDDAQRQIVITEYDWGLDLLGKGLFDEARNRLIDFVRHFPLDERTQHAYFTLGALEVQREDYAAAIGEWRRLLSKYPKSDLSSQAQYRIGTLYESKLVDLEKALAAYVKVTFGPYRGEARARVAAMKAKTLKVVTERAFTSMETPKVKITTRNIEALDMRIYRIDMADYFVKRGTIYSVEDLDIDLIEPAKKWNAPVEEFQQFAELAREVELPFTEPGAYVLNVSDGERTATALVLVTDLQMILKSGREDLLVFVEDVRRKTPAEGVQVMVSDGKKILFRGRTGSDGVFHGSHESLKSANALRVLVAKGGLLTGRGPATDKAVHFASNNLSLRGLSTAKGLEAKAFLFTDRPIYKPGATVRLKGFLREVSKGRYTVADGDEYTLTLFAPDGRAVAERKAAVDSFGGLDADFVLAAAAPYGGYRIDVRARSGWTGSRTFTVGEYVAPKVTIAADMASDVFYQGERVKGAFKVFYNYGEPATGKLVRYSFGTGVTLEGVVDEKGLVPFEIDTRDFGGSGRYVLTAEVLDESALCRKTLHIADTGFALDIDLSRDVVIAGEQVTVALHAGKPDGKPAEAEAELRVIRLEKNKGVVSEKEIKRISGVAVEKETGRGSAVVRLERGGDYRIRAAARDLFGNLITAEQDIFVSGEEDKVKLRMFADKATFDAGTDAPIRVHTRCKPGLALLTCEGERIFHYEVRRLERGDNNLSVRMAPGLAPNFTFAAALMDGHSFHKAQVDLNVRSNLKVTVEPQSSDIPPGGKVRVKITAEDRAGKPVEAQFALAAVDSALLARFPDETGPIHEFFFGRKRKGRLKTDSSCTFEYRARTKAIDSALREEQRRAEGEERAKDKALAQSKAPPEFGSVSRPSSGRGGRYKGPGDAAPSLKKNKDARVPPAPGPAGPSAAGPTGPATAGVRFRRERLELKAERKATGGEHADDLDAIDAFTMKLSRLADSEPGDGGRTLPVRKRFLETAFWGPVVTTGADGTAVVEFDLPHNTTTWTLMARGLTRKTVGGRAESAVRARKDFFVELSVPRGLVEKDMTSVTTRLVNSSGKDLAVEMTLHLDGPIRGERTRKKKVKIPAGGIEETGFEIEAAAPGFIDARLTATALAGSGGSKLDTQVFRDEIIRSITVRPMGVEINAGRGGTASGSWNGTVALPAEKEYSHSYMEIEVGPSLSDAFLHMAGEHRRFGCLPTLSDMASRVLVKLNVLDYLRRSGHSRVAGATRIEKETATLLSSLLLAQNRDGGFPWIRKGAVSPLATAQALKAMALARRLGFAVPEKAVQSTAEWIGKHQRTALGNAKAFYLHAGSFFRKPDFTSLNSLFRQRTTLSDQGLALLALAFHESGHRDNAATLAGMLIERAGRGETPWADKKRAEVETDSIALWIGDPYMTTARATLAVALSKPRDPVVKKGIAFLMSAGRVRPQTGPGHAAAAAALAEYLAGAGLAASDYTLGIVVNGELVKKLTVEGAHPVTTVAVPPRLLKAGDNDVAFRFAGRGEYAFNLRMTGFTKEVEPGDFRKKQIWVKRKYLMAPLVHRGREVPSGFSTVSLPGDFEKWEHDLKEINRGETARVELEWGVARGRGDSLHPLVITDTLPAGCRVVETGLEGRFDHYELGPGTITFYVRGGHSKVSYPIYAAFPGSYRMPPAVVRSTCNPDMGNNSEASAIPLGERGTPKKATYRMTPDELYNLGVALIEDREPTAALAYLESYLNEYSPRKRQLVDAAEKLFRIAFDSGDSVRLIRYFELLRERAPSLAPTFQETARVGSAYRARGEHEQALQIMAMVAGSSFGLEAKVAEALEKQGETAGALLFLANQIRSYPDLPGIQSAYFALSQAVLDKAGPAGGRPAIAGLPRSAILTAAIGLVIDFLATYPQNPICDEAAYSLISTYLDLERSGQVVRLSPLFRERWPKSPHRASMEYAEAYALFESGNYDKATALLKRVADRNPDRLNPEERDNRDLAVYILGQIDHAAGRIGAAVEHYRQVLKKFGDAAEAVEFFTRKTVNLPEISAFRSGEEVKVKLNYRNVPEVTLSVYKVDLMKLCLLRKNLNDVTDINLAGINPTIVEKVALGDGRDYKEKTKELKLPLAEKGAYMLVVQGEGTGCTGMILVADLSLDIQEDRASGRVRVNVKDQGTGAFLKNVYVKVIGSNQSVFKSGYTDLRGVFIADGVDGNSTVIAERRGEYAFHRGSVALLLKPPRRSEKKQTGEERRSDNRGRALQNIFHQNRALQQAGAKQLEEMYQQDFQNVRIK
jgi:alpha-2-macroglobulin